NLAPLVIDLLFEVFDLFFQAHNTFTGFDGGAAHGFHPQSLAPRWLWPSTCRTCSSESLSICSGDNRMGLARSQNEPPVVWHDTRTSAASGRRYLNATISLAPP